MVEHNCAMIDADGNRTKIPCPDGNFNTPGQTALYDSDGNQIGVEGTATSPTSAPPPATGPQNQGSNGNPGPGGGGGGKGSAPIPEVVVTAQRPRHCINITQIAVGAAQTAAGIVQAFAGTAEGLAALAGAPETGGLSLAALANAFSNQAVGALAVVDGLALLNQGLTGGEDPGSTLGNIGESIGGDQGRLAGDSVNIGIAAVAAGRGDSLLGIAGKGASLANLALAGIAAVLPGLPNSCQQSN
jgi:hypothetical protein